MSGCRGCRNGFNSNSNSNNNSNKGRRGGCCGGRGRGGRGGRSGRSGCGGCGCGCGRTNCRCQDRGRPCRKGPQTPPRKEWALHKFKDGDVLPRMSCFGRGGERDEDDAQWCIVEVEAAKAGTTAWIERGTRTLRVRLPPGVKACDARAALVCQNTALTRTVPMRLVTSFEYRSYDGSDNNHEHPEWGVANTELRRSAPANYGDGQSSIRDGPNPRAISNAVCAGPKTENAAGLTDMVWAWGQFLDHEIDLTPAAHPVEHAPVQAPANDPVLPNGIIGFTRSTFAAESTPRQQNNVISSYIDGTNVYGFNDERARGLRRLDGSGKLNTSQSALLPYNVGAVYTNANANPNVAASELYLAGDERANENALLLAMHTLFVREHNRLCDELGAAKPELKGDDERLYQEARRIVVALMQHITFHEFLPTLLGGDAPPAEYPGYDAEVDASVANEFSTAAYRLGHTMVSGTLWLNADGSKQVELRDVFFTPGFVAKHGIDGLLSGASAHVMQEIDTHVVDDLRNFLFGAPGQPPHALHDLATLNIQRGRDHGVARYNDLRVAYDLEPNATFADVTSDEERQQALASVYASPDDMDAWIGGLAEDHHTGDGNQVGELFTTVLRDQFERFRSGDRQWYERSLPADLRDAVRATTLADIVRRNTSLDDVPDNVFQRVA